MIMRTLDGRRFVVGVAAAADGALCARGGGYRDLYQSGGRWLMADRGAKCGDIISILPANPPQG